MDTRKEEIQLVLGEMRQELCEKGGALSFKIVSGSMAPVIREGDLVRVTRAEVSRLRIGDIVAFRDGDRVVVHRIFGRSRLNGRLVFRQRGDTVGGSGIIRPENLIGRVSSIERGGGEISLDTPWYRVTGALLGRRMWLRRFTHNTGFLGTLFRYPLKLVWLLTRKVIFWRS